MATNHLQILGDNFTMALQLAESVQQDLRVYAQRTQQLRHEVFQRRVEVNNLTINAQMFWTPRMGQVLAEAQSALSQREGMLVGLEQQLERQQRLVEQYDEQRKAASMRYAAECQRVGVDLSLQGGGTDMFASRPGHRLFGNLLSSSCGQGAQRNGAPNMFSARPGDSLFRGIFEPEANGGAPNIFTRRHGDSLFGGLLSSATGGAQTSGGAPNIFARRPGDSLFAGLFPREANNTAQTGAGAQASGYAPASAGTYADGHAQPDDSAYSGGYGFNTGGAEAIHHPTTLALCDPQPPPQPADPIQLWRQQVEAAVADYVNMCSFPDAPALGACRNSSCAPNAASRALKACPCQVEHVLREADVQLKQARAAFHPDKFAVCRHADREVFVAKAQEMFVILNRMYVESKQ